MSNHDDPTSLADRAFTAPTSASPLRAERPRDAPLDVDQLHAELELLNRARLVPAQPTDDPRRALEAQHARQLIELDFLERELTAVRARALQAPRTARGFVAWFERLRDDGPGQGDPLFPWLAEHAELSAFRWFLRQEVSGEAGFEDLVALTQLRMPAQAKLELARNYWDELGRGHAGGMHGPMLHRLATALHLDEIGGAIVWEARALANLMVGLAANRRYAYHSVGALGVIELTAPGRSALVNAGLRRCGVPAHTRQYYALHATLDVKHSEAWNREVLYALVDACPDVAPAIAEGALARLTAGARCFARYRRELGLTGAAERAA
ncbi:MAG TPA: iron-containing redox enzyme family protein [Kofleriaceae bacterium]|nr:iron-containing redox enzyme family protein [Kofleriaceae bacterium]